MTTTRNLTVTSPVDLLAVVPGVLGFHPDESVVLLALGADTSCCHARVDLPEDPAETQALVDHLVGVGRRNGLQHAAVVLYSDDELKAETVGDRLCAGLEGAGVDVVETLRVDDGRWFRIDACDGPCCPPEGTPYDLASHRFTAQAVLDGRITLGSRRELAESLVGTDLEAIDAVGEAADAAMDRFQAAARLPLGPPAPDGARAHLVREGKWVRHRVRRYLADGDPLDDHDAGRLLVAMIAVEVRDVAWAEMSRTTAERHLSLWRDLVRRSPMELLAAPAALLGFAAWLTGDGALAWCAVERCQEAEPGYRLAGLLTQALTGAVSPSSWRPVDHSDLTLFAG